MVYDFGFHRVTSETLAILVGSVHSFSFGFFIVYILRNSNRCTNHFEVRVWHWLAFSKRGRFLLYILIIFVLLFLSLGAFNTYSSLGVTTAVDLRKEYYESGGESAYGNVYITVIRDIVIKPICFSIIGIAFLRLLRTRLRFSDYAIFIIAFLSLVLLDIASLARGQVTNGAMFIGILIIFSAIKLKSGISYSLMPIKRLILLFMPIIFFSLSYIEIISKARMGSGILNGLDNLLAYWTIGFPLFEKRDYLVPPSFDGFIYSFGGIQQFIDFLLRRIGLSLPPKTMYLQDFLPIGSGWSANALFTWCLAFYADLGIFGTVLMPFIFGVIVALVYRKWVVSKDGSFLILFGYLELIALTGVQEWRLMWMDQIFILLFLCFLTIKLRLFSQSATLHRSISDSYYS